MCLAILKHTRILLSDYTPCHSQIQEERAQFYYRTEILVTGRFGMVSMWKEADKTPLWF